MRRTLFLAVGLPFVAAALPLAALIPGLVTGPSHQDVEIDINGAAAPRQDVTMSLSGARCVSTAAGDGCTILVVATPEG